MRILLHHYPESPYSEKIRRALAFKKLPWISVEQPKIMPKPDQIALTAGYRKAPVLQVGANLYCDTRLIADVLETLQPAPSLFPGAQSAVVRIAANWCDQNLFRLSTLIGFKQPQNASGMSRKEAVALLRDRATMMKDARVLEVESHDVEPWLKSWLGAIDGQLGRAAWLCGDEPSIADLALYHPLWFLNMTGNLSPLLSDLPRLAQWQQRVAAWPDTMQESISAQAAIDEANAHSVRRPADAAILGSQFQVGQRVAVTASDYGFEPTIGNLICLTENEIILQHSNERVRDAVVHFPRFGYRLSAADDVGG
ncbi:MAG: glutathione S-transferase family protein [Leptospirales bacterium]|nr:glutathione S-transferase family protein [Leptospirales bacterium]